MSSENLGSSGAYLDYKEAKLPWLQDIPSHWQIVRGKGILKSIDIRSVTGDEELLTVSSKSGVIPRRTATVTMFKAESYIGYKLCWPGDLVINSLWAWATGLGVSKYHGIVSSAYGVYRVKSTDEINPNYLHLLVRSIPFQWELQVRSKGIWTSRLQLTDESFLDAPFLIPPLAEQNAIVRYLDYIDRRIRRYIRAKQKLIKLLNEQKQAIIHQAVTRGLDPHARLKPSGVEWLGDVPEHWKIVSAKYVCNIYIPQRDKPELNPTYGLPWVTLENIGDKFVSESENFIDMETVGLSSLRPLPKGSVIASCVGRFGIASINPNPVIINQQLQAYIPYENIDARYLRYCVQVSKPYFDMEGNSTTLAYVNRQGFSDLPLPHPDRHEQEIIVNYLEEMETNIQKQIDLHGKQIRHIYEYRTRLIADVVTGKLDVRQAAARLPDEIETPELEVPLEDEEPSGDETQEVLEEEEA